MSVFASGNEFLGVVDVFGVLREGLQRKLNEVNRLFLLAFGSDQRKLSERLLQKQAVWECIAVESLVPKMFFWDTP